MWIEIFCPGLNVNGRSGGSRLNLNGRSSGSRLNVNDRSSGEFVGLRGQAARDEHACEDRCG